MFNIRYLCALGALAASLSVAADELSETGEFLDGVAAIVNEGIVLKSQFYEELALIREQAELQDIPLPPDDVLHEQIMERVILSEIQLQRAERRGLEISDEYLNRVIADMAAQRGIEFTDLPAVLAREGIEYQDLRREMREDLTMQQLRQIEVMRQIFVSEREIQHCIADLENNVVVNSDYNLSHILLPLPEGASSSEIDEIVSTAQMIYETASDGGDFRQLAVRYSQGPTAFEGGALGWLKGEEVPTIFTEILGPLESGDVSAPFRTANSIHIVKVNDMRSAVQRSSEDQILVRHILVRPNEIMDEATAQQRAREAYDRVKGGEDFSDVAKLLSDDPGSANAGGDLGWAGPGTFAPEFENAVKDLEIGEITEPFRSPFGWHVAELMERRVYDNTEDLKQQNCIIRIRASKAEEETNLWLRRLRDEAYVEIRM